jgi:FkbM family methyltransferase
MENGQPAVLQCCIAYNGFGGYCIPLSSRHRPAAQTVLGGRVYEPRTIAYLTSRCGDGDIVHAGTYFGDFLPALSRACVPEARIWAFEPNPENYRCAVITCCINGLDRVELINAALGEKQGALPMLTKDERGRGMGGGSRIVANLDAGGTELVKVVTVDEVVPPDLTVSILQLDVESHEKEALLGAAETIRRSSPIIVLESLPEDRWFSENLVAAGYRVTGNVEGNAILERSLADGRAPPLLRGPHGGSAGRATGITRES